MAGYKAALVHDEYVFVCPLNDSVSHVNSLGAMAASLQGIKGTGN